jgi:hypothetical protein
MRFLKRGSSWLYSHCLQVFETSKTFHSTCHSFAGGSYDTNEADALFWVSWIGLGKKLEHLQTVIVVFEEKLDIDRSKPTDLVNKLGRYWVLPELFDVDQRFQVILDISIRYKSWRTIPLQEPVDIHTLSNQFLLDLTLFFSDLPCPGFEQEAGELAMAGG